MRALRATSHPLKPTQLEQERPPHATGQLLNRGVRVTESLIAVLAVLLLAAAALLQIREAALALWHGFVGTDTGAQLTMALSHTLSTLMIAEIIGTVGTFLKHGIFSPTPFLVVGIIASIRRLLVITAEAAELFAHGTEVGIPLLLELGLLTLSVAVFAWAIRYLQGSYLQDSKVGEAA